jgi:hypothetical protein
VAQPISRQLLALVSPHGICPGPSGAGTGVFTRVLWFSPLNIMLSGSILISVV